MSILSLKDVSAFYGDLTAVDSVSFDVGEGEVVALVGANGAGKSTLMRAISGAHHQVKGTFAYEGQDLAGVSDNDRVARGIALVPEGRRLFGSLTVKENLVVGAATRREGRWDLDAVLEVFPMLQPLLNRNATQLSGGQQQAVAIGRALMSNPQLLLLDEVSLGLAPIVVDEVYGALDSVLKEGLAVVLVEQDLTRAFKSASRLVCMLEGRVVLEGGADQLSRDEVSNAYFGHSVKGGGMER